MIDEAKLLLGFLLERPWFEHSADHHELHILGPRRIEAHDNHYAWIVLLVSWHDGFWKSPTGQLRIELARFVRVPSITREDVMISLWILGMWCSVEYMSVLVPSPWTSHKHRLESFLKRPIQPFENFRSICYYSDRMFSAFYNSFCPYIFTGLAVQKYAFVVPCEDAAVQWVFGPLRGGIAGFFMLMFWERGMLFSFSASRKMGLIVDLLGTWRKRKEYLAQNASSGCLASCPPPKMFS